MRDERMNELTGAVIGAAIEVHRVLEAGFLESVYSDVISLNPSFATLTTFKTRQLFNSGRETPQLSNVQHSLFEPHPLSFENNH